MKQITLTFFTLFITFNGWSQTSMTVDTVYYSTDSTVVYIETFCDSNLTNSYYGSWTNNIDTSYYRHGFLWLKKRMVITENLSHKWDIKSYPANCRKRGHGLVEPGIFRFYDL